MNKIAIDARFLLRSQRGMPLYVSTLCKLLPKHMTGMHFYILVNTAFEHNDKEDNYKERLKRIEGNSNVTIVDIKADDEISWETKLLPKWLKEIKPDLLHMPTNRVCLFTNVKQISTFHDSMEWSFLKKIHAIPTEANFKLKLYFLRKRLYVWFIYMYGLRKVDRVLTISNFAEKSLVSNFKCVQKKIDYTYHGVPEGYLVNHDVSSLSKRKGILMLGGDSYQKNPENAIRAWNMLSEEQKLAHPLIIAGFTGNESSPLAKEIKALGLTENIIIKKWIDESLLIELFQKSSLLLFASREEGFGFPLIQAMACGTPVVTSEAEVLVEIGGKSTLTAAAENPTALAKKMDLILSSEVKWLELHHKSLNRAKIFTWNITCSHIADTYKKLLT
jgi:glycosyltransferase involved in cell wall biosynthesis